jgi:hypothetical protein
LKRPLFTAKKYVESMTKYSLWLVVYLFAIDVRGQEIAEIDFENDGIPDRAILIESENGWKIRYTLSGESGKEYATEMITTGGQSNLNVVKNVLVIKTQLMRSEKYFKFRWDNKTKKIILIGYDYVQYGNAVHTSVRGIRVTIC